MKLFDYCMPQQSKVLINVNNCHIAETRTPNMGPPAFTAARTSNSNLIKFLGRLLWSGLEAWTSSLWQAGSITDWAVESLLFCPFLQIVLPDWYRLCQHLRREGASCSTGRSLLALLEPLESVWRQLSTEDRMHLSVVRPLGALLKKQLATAGESSESKKNDVDWPAIRKKWTEILSEEFEADENHQVASLLDPRFKSLPFVAEAEREGFHAHLRAQACSKAAVSFARHFLSFFLAANSDWDRSRFVA